MTPRSRLNVLCLVVTAWCLLQAPGRIAADTKLDLVVDPMRFLGRALRLWQPEAAFGHIQNQAVGYLFPMGPFFALGDVAGIPMWIVQRLWMAAILVFALRGAVRVAEELDIGTPSTRLFGGAAYALSPAIVVFLAHTSGGLVPAAALPWVLLPLIRGSRQGSPRQAAARSALAVAAMGAVNAASSVGVLPLPLLWLLTRQRGPRRRRLLLWWCALTPLACLWWAVPLALQARYGLDFVPFTEPAAVTNATTSAVEAVRGTGHWLTYLFVNGPWLPGGWELNTVRAAIAATVALSALGLFGITRRDAPERTFLAAGLIVGTTLVCAGYAGPLGGGFSAQVRELLDGPFAAVRNVSKFEPVLRLPLALGLAHVLALLRVERMERALVAVATAVVVAAAAWPLVRADTVLPGSFEQVPRYWTDAAKWLAANSDGGRTLLVPAASFAEYDWGRPLDEPLQALARSPWATRDLIPLGSVGATRLLDDIERVVTSGRPDPGLAPALARAGVRFVVARNSLDRLRVTAPAAVYVRRSLGASPGLRLVRSFGPSKATGPTTDRLTPDLGAGSPRVAALDVYEVTGTTPHAVAYPLDGTVRVSGGPEAVRALTTGGQIDDGGAVLAGDVGSNLVPEVAMLTDGQQRRDVDFGAVRDNFSYVLTPGEPAPGTRRPPRDRLVVPGTAHQTVATMSGATRLRASSYGASGVREPEVQPYAAVDGDPATAWVASPQRASRGQWLEVQFADPISVPSIEIRPLRDHPWRTRVTRVRVRTDAGTVTERLRDSAEAQPVTLPKGPTRTLRVTFVSTQGTSSAGISELTIPGVRIVRSASLPRDVTGPVRGIGLDRARTDPYDATRDDEEPVLRRRVTMPADGVFIARGSAVPRAGAPLDQLTADPTRPSAGLTTVASSTWESLPAFGVANLTDNDATTAWVADPDDTAATVSLSWAGERVVDRVRVRSVDGPVLRPTRLRILSSAGVREVTLSPSGSATFPPLRTAGLSVSFPDTDPRSLAPGEQGLVVRGAVGLAELHFPALADLEPPAPDPSRPVELPCGSGPPLAIDGVQVPTRAASTVGALRRLEDVGFEACRPVELAAGAHEVVAPAGTALTVGRLSLVAEAPAPAAPARRVRVTRWAAERRSVEIGSGAAALLTTDENLNDGWVARLGDRRLPPVRVDGWRQAWLVPAGAGGTVTLDFSPGRAYRAGLLIGGLGVLLVASAALLRTRRRDAGSMEPLVAGSLPRGVAETVAVAVAFVVGGPFVLLAPGLVLVARAWPGALPALTGSLFAAAGLVVVLQPGRFPDSGAGAFSAAAQALAVAALVLTARALRAEP